MGNINFKSIRRPAAIILVELLVVIAIIGILAVLLMPVMACSKLKHIRLINLIYAEDANDTFIQAFQTIGGNNYTFSVERSI